MSVLIPSGWEITCNQSDDTPLHPQGKYLVYVTPTGKYLDDLGGIFRQDPHAARMAAETVAARFGAKAEYSAANGYHIGYVSAADVPIVAEELAAELGGGPEVAILGSARRGHPVHATRTTATASEV